MHLLFIIVPFEIHRNYSIWFFHYLILSQLEPNKIEDEFFYESTPGTHIYENAQSVEFLC